MHRGEILDRSFFERDTVSVARLLLGTELVLERASGAISRVRIVETEAYVGPDDRASHAFRGRTRRTEVMFGPAGHAYVYLIYGFHSCLNIVTEDSDMPAAVLIRGAEPISNVDGRTDGPGRLCRALGIDRGFTGQDMTMPPLYVQAACSDASFEINCGPRVGVAYAGEWAARPWRFWIRANPWVSRPPKRSIGLGLSRMERGRWT
jgi:DNA-3-methyladenine glycosylase